MNAFLPIVDACVGCKKVVEEGEVSRCKVYLSPAAKWRMGHCPMATHVVFSSAKEEKKRVGQQKQKKHK